MPRCDHVVFRVSNLERSIAFYTELLPANLISRRLHEDRWRSEIATLEPLGQAEFRIVLIEPRRARHVLALLHALVPRQSRSHEHVGFACATREEFDARVACAHRLGARIENPPTHLPERDAWVFEVLDPDRNGLEWTFGPVHD